MREISIRDATPSDFESICALNLAEIQHTSQMDLGRLAALVELSCYRKVACVSGSVVAFLIAMRHDAPYVNDNFAWFARSYPRFIYIDRIVVSAANRGLRIGSLMYEDLIRYARTEQIPVITCEYNIEPPNEPSRIFHDRLGFKEQGTHWVANASKRVSLQARDVQFSQPV